MTSSPAVEPQRFGKYQILERIASGGMAEIFKARLDGIGGFHRTFAIKRILPNLTANPEFVDLLVEEAKIAGLLSHANIVQILDLGAVDNQYYIAMEYVHGRDLGVLLKRCGDKNITFPVPHAVYVLLEMLKALEYAHNRQVLKNGKPNPLEIVHRDVSPPNVLVSFQGEVKLTDFGIAKAAVRALETMSGVIKGRFDYMSPEQASGDHVDQRSDLFSAGVVFYQLLTGRHPFRQPRELATVEAIRRGTFETPSHVNPDVPASLDRVVTRALAVDPAQRYPNATAFREDLDRFFQDSGFIFSGTMLASFVRGLFPEVETRPGVDIRTQLKAPVAPPRPTRTDDVDLDEDPHVTVLPSTTPTLAPKRPEAPILRTAAAHPPDPSRPAKEAAPITVRMTRAPVPSLPADHALRDTSALLANLPSAPPPDGREVAGESEEATLIRTSPMDTPAAWTEAETVIRLEPGADTPPKGAPRAPTARGVADPPPPPRLPEPRAEVRERRVPARRPEAPGTAGYVHAAYAMIALIALVVGTLAGIFLERTGTAPVEPIVTKDDPVLELHYPDGARISVNGRFLDVASPATYKLQPNKPAVVKLSGAGYGDVETRVTLDYNQMRVITFSPVETPPKVP
jgi:serine/threonine protein kinase